MLTLRTKKFINYSCLDSDKNRKSSEYNQSFIKQTFYPFAWCEKHVGTQQQDNMSHPVHNIQILS